MSTNGIFYGLHRFGADAAAVEHLINGSFPEDDEERWQVIDAPRYHIQLLLDAHLRAQNELRECQDTRKPFVLFLRSFGSEFTKLGADSGSAASFCLDSVQFQQNLKLHLEDEGIPLFKLHGGSDGFFADSNSIAELGQVNVLSTNGANWETVVGELIEGAAAIVFLVSVMSAGVEQEFNFIRAHKKNDRCLVMLFQPRSARQLLPDEASRIRLLLPDFPHIFTLEMIGTSVFSDLKDLGATLKGLFQKERPQVSLQHAINAPFTYLEPNFLQSRDYALSEAEIWQSLRQLRVLFDDAYWVALKEHQVDFSHFTFPDAWCVAHRVYGVGIATADFKAVREVLFYLKLLYSHRHHDYAYMLDVLAAQFKHLSKQIYPGGEPDLEQQFIGRPDVLKFPSKKDVAIQLFQAAQEFGQQGDAEEAIYLYHAAAICALKATDCTEEEKKWVVANICRDWASYQNTTAQKTWAVTNCLFAVTLFRKLAQTNPDKYLSSQALCLNNLGSLLFQNNDFASAEGSFTEALTIRRSLPPQSDNYRVNLYNSLSNLGLVHVELNDFEKAYSVYTEAIALCEKERMDSPNAIADLTRIYGWMCLCLAQMPDRENELLKYAHLSEKSLAKVSKMSPERTEELRPLQAEVKLIGEGKN